MLNELRLCFWKLKYGKMFKCNSQKGFDQLHHLRFICDVINIGGISKDRIIGINWKMVESFLKKKITVAPTLVHKYFC